VNLKLLYSTLRGAIEDPYRPREFRAAFRELQQTIPQLPAADLLERLRAAWGNQRWSAESPYLAEVARQAAEAEGPIVECGSGLTTLILAAYARPGVEVWSLEDNRFFRQRVSKAARAQGITHAHVLHTPIVEYPDFQWYDIPPYLPDDIALVVCDGPPASGTGGRVGAMYVLASRLGRRFRLLLDDAVQERTTLLRWQEVFDIKVSTIKGLRQDYALVSEGSEWRHLDRG
jgi:hypothetical protein